MRQTSSPGRQEKEGEGERKLSYNEQRHETFPIIRVEILH